MVRETIYTTLFNKLKTITGFPTVSRRLRHWSEVGASDQPALFMVQKKEVLKIVGRGVPPSYRMDVELFLYATTQDNEPAPAAILNPLIDAIEALLAPDPETGVQNLGLANVSHCYIDGTIETDEGVLGTQSVAILPICILAT